MWAQKRCSISCPLRKLWLPIASIVKKFDCGYGTIVCFLLCHASYQWSISQQILVSVGKWEVLNFPFDTSGGEPRVFQSNYWVNAMIVDTLASCITRTSAAMVLTMLDKQVLIMHKERITLTAPSKFCEMIENMNIYFMFSKIIQHDLHCNLHCWS